MKKIIITLLALTLLVSILGVSAAETEAQTNVFVTIADKDGKLALVQQSVAVTDTDADGRLTLNDALFCAHESNFEGGAAAGFASSDTAYGKSLDKLWGTANGGSYGYCINNLSSTTSLLDEIENGDFINAYIYTDLASWSDTYCYFDLNSANAQQDESITLTLSAASFDQNWQPITIPVENAIITLNCEKTAFKTDKDGKVTFSVDKAGSFIVSAVSDSMVLVPPALKLTVAEKEPLAPIVPEPQSMPTSPKTRDNRIFCLYMLAAVLSLAVIIGTANKKAYEK